MTTVAESLVGTYCPECDRTFYPARDLCPACYREGLGERALAPTGKLATWTVVRTGKRFAVPYALCYADFAGDVRVLGRVTNWAEGMTFRPGMTVTSHAVNQVIDGRLTTTEHTFTVDPADPAGPADPEA